MPGDCAYIPMRWWFQILTKTISKKAPKGQEQQEMFEEDRRKLSISVDFWYGSHSLFVNNVFAGVEAGKISWNDIYSK